MFGSSPSPVPDRFEPAVGAPIAEPVAPYLIVLFGLRACWYESFPFDGQLPRIEDGRIVIPADEPGVASWSGEVGIELPVRHDGMTLGRYVLIPSSPTTGVGFSTTAREEAMSMAAGVGARIAAAIVAEHGGENERGAVVGEPARPSADSVDPRRRARGRRGVK